MHASWSIPICACHGSAASGHSCAWVAGTVSSFFLWRAFHLANETMLAYRLADIVSDAPSEDGSFVLEVTCDIKEE